MQEQLYEELCNLLIRGLVAKDEKLLLKVFEQDDENAIKDIINRVPVNHVRKLIIELSNLLSNKLTINHLQWLQQLIALRYSVVASMADGRSILLPLVSLLDDKSSPAYYKKLQGLKGKLTLLRQLKEVRRSDAAQTVVRVPVETEKPAQMEVEYESDTESEEELGSENEQSDDPQNDELQSDDPQNEDNLSDEPQSDLQDE